MRRVYVTGGTQFWIVVALLVVAVSIANAVSAGSKRVARRCGAVAPAVSYGKSPQWAAR